MLARRWEGTVHRRKKLARLWEGREATKIELAMLWIPASSRSHVSEFVELIIEPPIVGGCEVAIG